MFQDKMCIRDSYGARTDQPAENMSFDGNIIENTSANGSYDAADGTYASNHVGTESDDTITVSYTHLVLM